MTIRDGRKEWVTSRSDTGVVSGRSRKKMHTVIAIRQTVGLAAFDRTQPETKSALASVEDFAALLPDKGDETTALEDPAAEDATSSAGQVVTEVWPVMPSIAGRSGVWGAMAGQLQSDGVQVPLPAAGSTPELVAGTGPAVVLPPDADSLVMGTATTSSAAQVLTAGSLPNQTNELPAAALPAVGFSDEQAMPAGAELAASRTLTGTDLALSRTDGAAGWAAVPGAAPPGDESTSAAMGLWSEVLPQHDGSASGKDGLDKPPASARLEGAQQILTLPGMPATAPAPAAATKLAETALQSLFIVQADSASQDEADGAIGFVPVGTPSSFLIIPSGSAPVAVPQLADQLVHTLARHGEGTTEIALSPDELGRLRLTLQADPKDPDRLMVLLSFERPETLDLFRRHADQLAEALRNAGFANVDIGFGHSGHGGNSHPQPDGAFADQPPAPETPPLWTPGPATVQTTLRLAGSGTLDLRL